MAFFEALAGPALEPAPEQTPRGQGRGPRPCCSQSRRPCAWPFWGARRDTVEVSAPYSDPLG